MLMPRVKFYTDFEQDLKYIKNRYCVMRKVFGEKEFNCIMKKYYPDIVGKSDKEIYEYFINNKKQIQHKSFLFGKILKERWKKIEKEYFKQMESIMKFKWKQKTYYCHFSSSFICGGGWWLPNKVVLFPRMTHFDPLMTICHELFHLHFFEFLQSKRIKVYQENLNEQIWDLSESLEFMLLELKIKGLKYEIRLFPRHEKLYKKLKSIWKGDFNDFMEKALKIAANYKKKG